MILQGWDIHRTIFHDLCEKWCPYVPYIYTVIVLGGTRRDNEICMVLPNNGALGHMDSIRQKTHRFYLLGGVLSAQ